MKSAPVSRKEREKNERKSYQKKKSQCGVRRDLPRGIWERKSNELEQHDRVARKGEKKKKVGFSGGTPSQNPKTGGETTGSCPRLDIQAGSRAHRSTS